jgi:hypothetical protein
MSMSDTPSSHDNSRQDGNRDAPARSRGGISRILKDGALYFAVVFAAGFVLGAVRVTSLAPRLGERSAELLELPVMVAVAFVVARWVTGRLETPQTRWVLLGVGGVGLALLLATEFTAVLWLRGLTVSQYFASRDPVSGAAYAVALALFGLMPLLAARRS